MAMCNIRKAEIKRGTYKAIINDYAEKTSVNGSNYFRFELTVFAGTKTCKILEIPIFVFANSKNFDDMVRHTLPYYSEDRRRKGSLHPEKHIGTVITVNLSIHTARSGDEYVQINWYRPYRKSDDALFGLTEGRRVCLDDVPHQNNSDTGASDPDDYLPDFEEKEEEIEFKPMSKKKKSYTQMSSDNPDSFDDDSDVDLGVDSDVDSEF